MTRHPRAKFGGEVPIERNGMMMSDARLSELGPVDYVVVEFPAGATNFTGEMAEELIALVDAGTIRVIEPAATARAAIPVAMRVRVMGRA